MKVLSSLNFVMRESGDVEIPDEGGVCRSQKAGLPRQRRESEVAMLGQMSRGNAAAKDLNRCGNIGEGRAGDADNAAGGEPRVFSCIGQREREQSARLNA